jgi:hypothetical protein
MRSRIMLVYLSIINTNPKSSNNYVQYQANGTGNSQALASSEILYQNLAVSHGLVDSIMSQRKLSALSDIEISRNIKRDTTITYF